MIIGLAGAAGCGKSTVAEHLRIKHKFFDVALADPLYDMVAAMTGMLKDDLKRRDQKEAPIDWVGKSPRQLLQLLGTEFGRSILGDDIWIRRLMRSIDATTDAMGRYWGRPVDCHFAVADVRFDNEAAAIRDRGGQVWLVERPGQAQIAGSHSSEAGVDSNLIDRVIVNSGSVRDLAAAVDEAWQSLLDGTMKAA